jgi:MraZ protein
MLIGEYRHTLDDKNRLSLPAKFRKEMGKKIIITRGLDRCLFVYPVAEWKKFSDKLAGLSIGSSEGRAFLVVLQKLMLMEVVVCLCQIICASTQGCLQRL